ncbi:flagellar basal body L-ring protein FlgH [Aromatoleum anaerobium]|nr:flagellar basal body L-ring protein FlgH [Aromatoleum anaerobium]MCK0509113.1 flagellar basal body L-ring protein FlgH [Aromatoleum anaerobium]
MSARATKAGRAVLPALVAALLPGCASIYSTPPTAVHQPMTARPEGRAQSAPVTGAIFQPGQARPLFEDRRARLVGDTLTINLVERNAAQKAANSSATRDSDVKGGITAASRVPFAGLAGMNVEAGVESEFSGEGASKANNQFNGTITVTVIEVYPNGNLLVSGEKQVAINQGNEFIRFSGVVNPTTVTAANTVQSTQVADARIEYKGSGYIDEANTMGWMQRFFNIVLPF